VAARAEDQIQRAVVEWIRFTCPTALVFHVPNGGGRTRAEAGRFKAIGVLAGVPDLIVMWPGVCAGLELKTPANRPTAEQAEIGRRMAEMGHLWGWASSVDDALALLRVWGIPTREHRT
jgi:hypothetical protein